MQGNITEWLIQDKIFEALNFEKAHVVCSDAVPDFIGNQFVDHVRTMTLNKDIINFCHMMLQPGGILLMKIIKGSEEKELDEVVNLHFNSLKKIKPMASRNESLETYYLCKDFIQSTDSTIERVKNNENRLGHKNDPMNKLLE